MDRLTPAPLGYLDPMLLGGRFDAFPGHVSFPSPTPLTWFNQAIAFRQPVAVPFVAK